MTEQNLQSRILKSLPASAWAVKTMSSNRAGVPDILICWRGHFIAIEVKRKGRKATPLQAENLEKIRAAGGFGAVIDSWDAWLEFATSIGLAGV